MFIVGTVSKRDEDKPKILCDSLMPLIPDEEYTEKQEIIKTVGERNTAEKTRKIYVRVPSVNEEKYPDITRVKAVFSIYEDDFAHDKAYLYSADDGKYYTHAAPVQITNGMKDALIRLCGKENVR